ncbi:hypothetical protein THAOC_25702 [Thalassiosira oceanica]|uniref:Leucine-rich repeat-containing N-terminal plant-type domain-containing protein n=1 Tax=Thalassiosira oceanica TaxID=159749 RepID=K0S0S3_THAOC|nr:hypothetical protein THAOC_25702 [Thalassiosira oceanica]|eukprot:EJK54651.1 hypothetical protein THAOC_25702 [Thalassiosira oceanica]
MLQVGSAVTIRGLASESARDHNGRTGVITSIPHGSGGRYNVRIDGVENTLAVRPDNITPAESRRVSFSRDASFRVGSTVRISGLKSAKEHNGKLATVASLTDARTGRVEVAIEGLGNTLAVKPCNLTLVDRPPESSLALVVYEGDEKGYGEVPWHRRHRTALIIVLATVVASLIVMGVVAGVKGKEKRSAIGEACLTATGCPTATDREGGGYGGAAHLAENRALKSFLTFHLESFGLDDVLSDPSGPSYRAYLWLANSDNLDELSDFRRMQRFGMAALFYGTTVSFHWAGRTLGDKFSNPITSALTQKTNKQSPGSDWAASTHWATDRSECDWYGVSCVRMGSAGSDEIIREISLPGNGLTGSIPSEAVLAGVGGRLAGLDLSGNAVGGTVPEVLGVFVNLSVLDLRDNDFTGRIPDNLGKLKNLEYLYVDGNAITGRMPDDLCSLVEDGVLNPVVADCGASGGLECDPDCCECV